MPGDLKKRLARLRELGLVKAAEMASPPPGAESPVASRLSRMASARRKQGSQAPVKKARSERIPPFLQGWARSAALLWTRELRFDNSLPEVVDIAPFQALVSRPSGRAALDSLPRPELLSTEALRFFDLETTGLSGGTGTVAFLAAVGRSEGDGFAVRQFFMEDYPGEGAFLEALLAEFREGLTFVTYNGRAFDMPLLRTRCVMNAIEPPEPGHVDALFASRRLWKRVCGGASLGMLERELLDVERGEDVPGSMIPDIWFSWLREGDHPLMRAAMSHNAEDVASLARLFAKAARVFAAPRLWAGSSALDRYGLGRTLLAVGRAEEGEELLEAALADGDESAGLLLSRRFRLNGRIGDRARILDMLPRSYRSCVERAKFQEHAVGDLAAAIAWSKVAAELAPCEKDLLSLTSRLARLSRKRARHR